MKRPILSIGAAVLVAGAQSVFAGPEAIEAKDSKAVVEPAPVVETPCNWTGIYLGLHGGYAFGDLRFREEPDNPNDDNPVHELEHDSFFGGGQVGVNFQLWSWLVIGAEGEFAGGDFGDRARVVETAEELEITTGHVDAEWFATAAGRVGVSLWRNRLLPYVKVGAVFMDIDYEEVGQEGSSDVERWKGGHDQTALLVGGGLEYAFNCHWSAKIEYKHFFLDEDKITGVVTFDGVRGSDKPHDILDPELDLVSFGLNYKF